MFWDRGTLYAFRGAFKAGAADRALERLNSYSSTRLTGFRVPYVVEAWPENGMAHLSAESALYCRIFTEGMLGIEPTGFKSFNIKPNLPVQWNAIELKNINAYNGVFDVLIKRQNDQLKLTVSKNGKAVVNKIIKNGAQISVKLN